MTRRTMYHTSVARIVYNSYEPALVPVPTYNRWLFAAIELCAAFWIGLIVMVLL